MEQEFLGKLIEIESRDGFTFEAYHAEAQGVRRGGVVVIQEIFGVSDHIREMADRFAAAGYEAIAPSMFDRLDPGYVVQPKDAMANMEPSVELAMASLKDGPAQCMSDIGACIDKMSGAGPVFVTGYCYGGLLSWLAASQLDGVSAASCYYGGRVPDYAGLELKCPAECHFGRNDPHIPMEKVDAFIAQRPDVPTYVYEAGHGFARRNSDDYDAASDALAFERTLKLFEANSG